MTNRASLLVGDAVVDEFKFVRDLDLQQISFYAVSDLIWAILLLPCEDE